MIEFHQQEPHLERKVPRRGPHSSMESAEPSLRHSSLRIGASAPALERDARRGQAMVKPVAPKSTSRGHPDRSDPGHRSESVKEADLEGSLPSFLPVVEVSTRRRGGLRGTVATKAARPAAGCGCKRQSRSAFFSGSDRTRRGRRVPLPRLAAMAAIGAGVGDTMTSIAVSVRRSCARRTLAVI